MNILEKIKSLYENMGKMVKLANMCDKAYAEGIGNSDWYKPFDESNPIKVAQNLAALPAVISAVSVICKLRYVIDKTEIVFIRILKDVDNDNLTKLEKRILLQFANSTWNAQQPFRCLDRIKNMNIFDLLPEEEVDKDWHQIKVVVKFLIEELS